MCFGESMGDTLGTSDQAMIRDAADKEFGAHDLSLHHNEDGIEWMVLSPRDRTLALLRFTICRIDPAVMVLAEDVHRRRQICSAPDIESALELVRGMCREAFRATDDTAPGPSVALH